MTGKTSNSPFLPPYLYELEIQNFLRVILNNVSGLLVTQDNSTEIERSFIEYNTTVFGSDREFENEVNGVPSDIVVLLLCSVGQILSTSILLWIVNRFSMDSKLLSTTIEVILSWVLLLISLPITFVPLVLILLSRLFVELYLRAVYKGKTFLMSPLDAVWSSERPGSPSTCTGLYVVQGDGDIERIRNLINTRVILKQDSMGRRIYDRFRWGIDTCFGFTCWRRLKSFDIKDYVNYFEGQKKSSKDIWTESDVFEEIGAIHDISLNSTRIKSPWEVLIIPKFDYPSGEKDKKYYAIVFRIMHCLMDGVSAGNLLHSCFADTPFQFSLDPISPLPRSKVTVWLSYLISLTMLPQITFRNLLLFEKNEFHCVRTLTGPKTMLWSRSIRLDTIKEIKNITNTSVFSVLFSCLIGSLRNLFCKYGYEVPNIIHGCPPLAILPFPDRRPRNRFAVVLFPVCIGQSKILERLKEVFSSSKKIARSPDVMTNYFIMCFLGLLPLFLQRILCPLAHATFTFSNMPGPSQKIKIFGGDSLEEVGAFIPIKNRIGIGMGLFSYANKLRITFICDQSCVPKDDVHFLREKFENELEFLATTLNITNRKVFSN